MLVASTLSDIKSHLNFNVPDLSIHGKIPQRIRACIETYRSCAMKDAKGESSDCSHPGIYVERKGKIL